MIVIGIDPHKRTHTAVAAGASGRLVAELVVPSTAEGASRLLAWARSLDHKRVWAVEDCRHVSRPLERFLAGHRERVVRVPPRLMAGQRRGDRRRGKSDPIDALAVARACLREPALPSALDDPAVRELKLLLDHRDDLVAERTRIESRLRWHLHELELGADVPAGKLHRPRWLSRLRSRLARLEQTTLVAIAREQLGRIAELTRRIDELERELATLTAAQAPSLLALPGCGVLTAAKLIAETGGIERFESDAQLALHAGTAPLDASSGQQQRHRLNRTGNRQLNCALHRVAITQARCHPPARAYLARKQAEGKTRREALRCLKRHLARTVYRTLKASHSPTTHPGHDPHLT